MTLILRNIWEGNHVSRAGMLRLQTGHAFAKAPEAMWQQGSSTYLFPEAVHQQLLRLQRGLQGLHELPRLAVLLLFLLQDRLHLCDGRG